MRTHIVSEPDPKAKRSYPYLGITAGAKPHFIVFFTSPKTGVVVWVDDGAGWQVGHSTTAWAEETFLMFNGRVVMTNG